MMEEAQARALVQAQQLSPIQEDWDSTTDGREMFLYMLKEDRKK